MNQKNDHNVLYLLFSLGLHLILFVTLLFFAVSSQVSEVGGSAKGIQVELRSQASKNSRGMVKGEIVPLRTVRSKKLIFPLKSSEQTNIEMSSEISKSKSSLFDAEKPELLESSTSQEVGFSDLQNLSYSGGDGDPSSREQSYLTMVRELVSQYQNYPRSSRVFGEEGLVRLLLVIERDGSLVKIEVVGKTLFDRLNKAAIAAAARAAPFPPFPKEVPFRSWHILLPIKFVLTKN
ncbi:MAG: TonB family protein [Bdellovibrionales bacterium]|nr:TonB family protein [Bdellovibrionales bacterium]